MLSLTSGGRRTNALFRALHATSNGHWTPVENQNMFHENYASTKGFSRADARYLVACGWTPKDLPLTWELAQTWACAATDDAADAPTYAYRILVSVLKGCWPGAQGASDVLPWLQHYGPDLLKATGPATDFDVLISDWNEAVGGPRAVLCFHAGLSLNEARALTEPVDAEALTTLAALSHIRLPGVKSSLDQ